MIVFLSSDHRYTHALLRKLADAPHFATYVGLFGAARAPRATYIFTDLDRLSSSALRLAAEAYRVLSSAGCLCLNDPARVCSRYALLKKLHAAGINQFSVYRLEAGELPLSYPAFVRSEVGHAGALTDLLPDRDALMKEAERLIASGHPERHLIAIEYAAEPIRPNLFRTYKIFRLNDELIAHPSDHERTWSSKANSVGLASQELYDQEFEMMQENPFRNIFQKVFELAHIAYGRADFGLVDGRVQVYEINTNPTLQREDNHPFPIRRQANALFWERYLTALRAIDDSSNGTIELDSPILRQWQRRQQRAAP